MSAPVPGIPALHETSYSRERLLNALREEKSLADATIAVAALHAHEIESDLVAVIERAAKGPLTHLPSDCFFVEFTSSAAGASARLTGLW